MPRDGSKTRLRILEETTALVLENGFSGTTIDQILERTSLTKGAFFYHFPNKAALALHLIRHFSESDLTMMEEAKAFAMEASEEPREQLMAFVQWHIDYFDKLTEPHAGCLYASIVYEPEQFDDEIKQVVTRSILEWRKVIAGMINKIGIKKWTAPEIHPDSLADLFTVIIEGAFITSKALQAPKLTADQLRHYRNYLDLLF